MASEDEGAKQAASIFPPACDFVVAQPVGPPSEYPYLASRVAARAGKMAGGVSVGMLGSAMATIGLSILQRKGRGGIGAVLLGGAAGLALLRRKNEGTRERGKI